MKRLEIPKGQLLQRRGDLNSKAYQVEYGLLRSYTIDEKGKEHIYMFAPANWIIADAVSRDNECDLYIDAIEDSVVIQVEKDPNKLDFSHTQKMINRLEVLQKRIIMLMSSSALERYEHFEETYPDIVQRVPQKMIASYLGITPEALSTVRSKRFQQKK